MDERQIKQMLAGQLKPWQSEASLSDTLVQPIRVVLEKLSSKGKDSKKIARMPIYAMQPDRKILTIEPPAGGYSVNLPVLVAKGADKHVGDYLDPMTTPRLAMHAGDLLDLKGAPQMREVFTTDRMDHFVAFYGWFTTKQSRNERKGLEYSLKSFSPFLLAVQPTQQAVQRLADELPGLLDGFAEMVVDRANQTCDLPVFSLEESGLSLADTRGRGPETRVFEFAANTGLVPAG